MTAGLCETCPERRAAARKLRRDAHRTDPIPHYVYRCYDETGVLIYVGCTNNPIKRIASHRVNSWWADRIQTTRLTVFPNRAKALDVERAAIAEEQPRCNVRGRWQYRGPHWAADDYLTLRTAIVQSVETTHGIYGVHTRQLLAAIDSELSDRFGITAIERSPA